MSWDSATGVLYSATPKLEQINVLSKFVAEHADELRRCYAPEFAHQRPIVTKFVSRLFVLLEREDVLETDAEKQLAKAVEEAADLLTRGDFFKGLFHHALTEGDLSLLELVYSSLFTEIVFNSDLTSLWFKERLDAEKNAKSQGSAVSQALNILISVQFLDIRQDWAAVKPRADLLLSIQKYISASKDTVLKLVWTLALYFMAQQHYANEQHGERADAMATGPETHENDDENIGIEPLMRELQTQAGVHWSQVLKDQLQVSLPGLETLVTSLEMVRKSGTLQFVSSQLVSQTVADVVSSLFAVSKPTESLCAALATAVEPYPALQCVPWVPVKQLALIKSKCPSSIGSLVSVAQSMDLAARVDYLNEMRTYVCAVNSSCLDLDSSSFVDDEPLLGSDVRTTQVVSVLPPRITDHQGVLELAPDTRGTLLASDGSDCLVMWYFTYNGWSLLGRILENADLIEENMWKPLTVEILRLVSITVDIGVLTAMSAGLSRGDIVDLVAYRLQSWIHSGMCDHTGLAFDFLAKFALIDPSRIWTLLSLIQWSSEPIILDGVRRLLIAVWPTFEAGSSLHMKVVRGSFDLFGSHYLLTGDVSLSLEVFELFLPVLPALRDDLLSPSPLRDITTAPLIANLDRPNVLRFCKLCIETSKTLSRKKTHHQQNSGSESFDNQYKRRTESDERANGDPNSTVTTESSANGDAAARSLELGSAAESSESEFTESSPGHHKSSYLEKQLFANSSEIASIFLTNKIKDLQQPILELWTAMLDNADAPPLLAFLDGDQSAKLKAEFMAIASNKLESCEILGWLARFLCAAQRQESLLDMLREPLLPLLEDQLHSISEPESLEALMEALKLVKGPLKPTTIEVLLKRVEEEDTSDETDFEALNAKRVAIELITQQIKVDSSRLKEFVKSIETLSPRLLALSGARPSLHSRLFNNLKSKWPSLATENGDTTTTFEFSLSRLDSKLEQDPIWQTSYRPEVLKVLSNRKLIKYQTDVVGAWCKLMVAAAEAGNDEKAGMGALITSDMLSKWVLQLLEANSTSLPVSLQRAEDERTIAALAILQTPRCAKTIDLLDAIFHHLTDLTMCPGAGIPALRSRMIASMKMALLVLSQFSGKNSGQPEQPPKETAQLVPIVLGLLDIVAIKQLQIFGAAEDTLQLHFLILSNCLRILEKLDHSPQELVQSMIESGSDTTILTAFGNASASNPWRGELILSYIQEWIRSRVMTDTFVRNGLINVLIDAPLSRRIQEGGIVANAQPELHSLWSHGILPTIAQLLQELESRISDEAWLFIENYALQISTCLDQWKSGHISMALIDETWVLCAVLRSVYSTRSKSEKAGIRFDEEELAKTIDVLLSHHNYLVSRTSPNADVDVIIKELRTFHEWLLRKD